jgi:N-acetylmuramoyl-L-alanine amidase
MTDEFDRFDSHSSPQAPQDPWVDDDFEVRTYDTGRFDAITVDDFDAEPEDADDWDAEPPAAQVEDDFTTVTVEPLAPLRRGPQPPHPPERPLTVRRRHVPRRRAHRKARTEIVWIGTLRTVIITGAAAVLVSTIFSLWTRPTFFSEEFRAGLNRVQATQRLINTQPTPLPTDVREVRIGIIAGHSGPPEDPNFEVDPGAVCPDGLTELEINESVAREVVTILRREQYTVDLLEEFDPRLDGYQADVLVSIHTNDCRDYGEAGRGYGVAAAARQTTRGEDEYLLECLINQYGATTGLPRHYGVTYDMTEYHTFSEISSDTPTAIIELGFMYMDRPILTQQPRLLAQGVANGIRCYLRPDLYTSP